MRYPQTATSFLRAILICTFSFLLSAVWFKAEAQSIDWVYSRLEWKKPATPPLDNLKNKPVLFCYLTGWEPSSAVLDALNGYVALKGAISVEVVVVWRQVGDRITDSLMDTSPNLMYFAQDRRPGMHFANLRAKWMPYAFLFDLKGDLAWEGCIDSLNVIGIIDEFAFSGQTPSDTTQSTKPTYGKIELDIKKLDARKTSKPWRNASQGVTENGIRMLARNASSVGTIAAAVEFLTPDATVVMCDWGNDSMLYDFDMVVPDEVHRTGLRDSVIAHLDSVLNTVTIVEPRIQTATMMSVVDTAQLEMYRSNDGISMRDFAIEYEYRFNRRLHIDSLSFLPGRFAFDFAMSTQDSTQMHLRNMGIVVHDTETVVQRIIVRTADIPESDLLYQFDRTYLIPTVGATFITDTPEQWYGAEVGLLLGKLSDATGLVGVGALRSCVELLTNGDRIVGGINAGVDISSLFILRLRVGVYSDFQKHTSLMLLPEFGVGYGGRFAVTIGGQLSLLGSDAIQSSIRAGLTYNFLPTGAR